MMDLLLYSVSKPSIRLVYISLVCNSVYCWRDSLFLRQRMICTSPPSASLPPSSPRSHSLVPLFSPKHPSCPVWSQRAHTFTHLPWVSHIPLPSPLFQSATIKLQPYTFMISACACVSACVTVFFGTDSLPTLTALFRPTVCLNLESLLLKNLWVKWWLTMNIYDQRCVSGV